MAGSVEVETGTGVPAEDLRFGFGENWARFAQGIGEAEIRSSMDALAEMLGTNDLKGKSFLDAGSGSGLSSLAAHRLGAGPIHSFDFDTDSANTTAAIRERFAPDSDWTVGRGDVLDGEWLSTLGKFDIVYSWGVLHHTGDMWRAFGNLVDRVTPGGTVLVALYNDEGRSSRRWLKIKRAYNRLPRPLRTPFAIVVIAPVEIRALGRATVRGRPRDYLGTWSGRRTARGMSRWHDILDWVGGYPFEVATPDEVLARGRACNLILVRMKTAWVGSGCNEFVFERETP